MFLRLRFYLVIGFVLLSSVLAHGGAGLDSLVSQMTRPTMQQVRDAMIADGVFKPANGQSMQAAAVMIATMESYYPGAIWLPLGRDASRLGDLLDAFYISIGQQGRVRRIELSSSSFTQTGNIAQFIEQLGWDPTQIDTSRPFIVFDRTSYGPSSQSTRIIKACYERFQEVTRRKPSELLSKFTLMSSSSGTAPEGGMENFFASIAAATDHSGRPSQILHIPSGASWTDGKEWHGSFGPIHVGSDGKLHTSATGGGHHNAKREVLQDQTGFTNYVSDPSFLAEVQNHARSLGYEFPLGEYKPEPLPDPEELARKRLETFKERLLKLKEQLPEKGEQTTYLSQNGQAYQTWLNEAVQFQDRVNPLLMVFVSELTVAQEAKKIGERDFRRLLARAIGKMNLPDDKLNERFAALVEASSLLKRVLVEKRGVFVESKKNDAAEVGKHFLILEKDLTCRKLIVSVPQVTAE